MEASTTLPQAIAFVNRVADAAEMANHHPDIHLHGWNKVRLELSTHSEGGLTAGRLRHGLAHRRSGLNGPLAMSKADQRPCYGCAGRPSMNEEEKPPRSRSARTGADPA